jgi:SAM-dependent methyltransferase
MINCKNKKSSYTKGRSMDFAHIFLRYFFESEYMHFGYWVSGEEIKFLNLRRAQERYAVKLMQMIPTEVKSILDVGCGSGEMARQLLMQNFAVDVVAPPSVMTACAKEKLRDNAGFYREKFEELNINKKYDLVLFSESFQFVPLEAAIQQTLKYSNKYILIADVFKKDMPERGPIGGGHRYDDFVNLIQKHNLIEIDNLDVTAHIAPQFDLEQDLFWNFVRPMSDVAQRIYAYNCSLLLKMLLRVVIFLKRRKLQQLHDKYFNKRLQRNSNTFSLYKTYRFILLQKNNSNEEVPCHE